MAVLPDFPDLIVDVRVDGAILEEYSEPADSNEDTPSSVTKYIQAVAGANFAIHLQTGLQFKYIQNDIRFSISLDGNEVKKSLVFKKELAAGFALNVDSANFNSGDGHVSKKFMFSTLSTDDGPVEAMDTQAKERLKELGQISVAVHRVEILEQVDFSVSRDVIPVINSVPEKALKGRALSRKTELGPDIVTKPPKLYKASEIDSRDKPFAIFHFRYRSMSDLRAELIIPRSLSPVPLENRPVEELSLEETRELIKKQREREQAARLVRNFKRERHDTSSPAVDDDDDVRIVTSNPIKRSRTERVDLTVD